MPPKDDLATTGTEVQGFTTHLLQTLSSTRIKLDNYVSARKAEVDQAVAAHAKQLRKEQIEMDEKVDQLLELQERGCGSAAKSLIDRREDLLQQKAGKQEELEKLQTKKKEKEEEVEKLKNEDAELQKRVKELVELKRRMEQSKNTTMDDLTKGIINYKYLGLDFEKAEGNRLKFTFTQMDAAEPENRFSFILGVNEEDFYEIHQCRPTLQEGVVDNILSQLNKNDDLAVFIRAMRRAFSETL